MAPTVLSLGDVAFLSLIADNPDTFSFVLLKDISAGTTVNVTDNGWLASGSFRTGEGVLQYVAPIDLAIGAVITYVANSTGNGPDVSSSSGWTNISGSASFALSTSGDSLIAFQGSLTGSGTTTTSLSPTLLAAVTINRSTFDADATTSNTSALPTGLTVGVNAVAVGQAAAEFDDSRYAGPTTFASVAEARTAINTASNWTGSDTVTTNFSGTFNIGSTTTAPGITITHSGGNTSVVEGDATDTYTIALDTTPSGNVNLQITADAQTQISIDGTNFLNSVAVSLNSTTPQTITVKAVDDTTVEASPHPGIITHTISSSADPAYAGLNIPNLTVNITDNDVAAGTTRIHDIQGAAHTSPLTGQTVTNVSGIVTAVAFNGFYLQDPNPDADDSTSEGIFVFTSSAPTVVAGDSILVSGTVAEFRPGNNANSLTTTQITSSAITTLSSGNPLPTAVILGNGGRAIPATVIENDATNVETSGTFDPTQDGIDFYESLEGMLVQVNNPVTTSRTNVFGTSEEIWVLADNGANATSTTARGGSLITATDFNPERIQIDDLNNAAITLPTVDVGAKLSTITGVVNYNFNSYEVLVSTAPTVVQASTLQKEVTNLTGSASQLTVATFNVENLDPGDGAAKFAGLADAIVNNLKAPDIINLEEIQDNNGPTNDSVVDASVTYQTLINAIATAGGPTYQYRQIDPVDDTNGGEPGGNIRVGFLFNPSRVSFVDRPGGTSTSSTTVTDLGNDGTPDRKSVV